LIQLQVAVDTPHHTGLIEPLDYTSEQPLEPGTLVRVPLGRREVPGVVWSSASAATPLVALRPISAALPSLPAT
jgi:primosomal protein N' (replication factor Y) (superfamily II helicase)